MTRDENFVKILFRLERDEDGYPPEDVESMWAVPVQGGYRLDNIPFFARGVSAEDVVSASEEGGVLYYTGLVNEGGHSTVRVLIWNQEETEAVREELRAMGCDSERTNIPGLIAVDIPPSVRYHDVRTLLDAGEKNGRWEYEEGCVSRSAAT